MKSVKQRARENRAAEAQAVDAALADQIRDDLVAYTVANIPGRNGRPWFASWFHERICAAIMRMERGEINRLFIKMPPQHGKSTIGNAAFPSWYLGRHPDHRIISCTYGWDLVRQFSNETRVALQSEIFAKVFPGVRVKAGDNRMDDWRLETGGGYRAAGMGGGISGFPANGIILDDLLKSWSEAQSDVKLDEAWSFYCTVALPRLHADCWLLMIGTAYNERDPMHRAIESCKDNPEARYEVISFPARNGDGSYLWPERYTPAFYRELEINAGPTQWNCVFQQDPTPREGALFKREGWGIYNGTRPAFKRIVQSWDTAFKQGEENDYSVCCTFGETPTDVWLLDVFRKRITYPELVRAARAKAEEYRPHVVLIEDKASGQSLIQSLKAETRLPIIPIKVDTDKVSRATSITGYVQAGRIKLPASAPWLADFMAEVLKFPNATHDDQVDAMVQGAIYMLSRRGALMFS